MGGAGCVCAANRMNGTGEQKMNPYLENLNRVEFVITSACTGRCKHCSQGDHPVSGAHIDGSVAAAALRSIARQHRLHSVMTFGGEPLLCPDAVCAIHAAAREVGAQKRQLISNGFFSRDEGKIRAVAQALAESGVNDILVSVDAFHQETIPLEPVKRFCEAVRETGAARLRVQPAWLTGEHADNLYNRRTREILAEFEAMGIAVNDGNVIFPAGNALKYLREYFDLSVPHVSPYWENPRDVRAICVSPDGGVLGGNIYDRDALEILEAYAPEMRGNAF